MCVYNTRKKNCKVLKNDDWLHVPFFSGRFDENLHTFQSQYYSWYSRPFFLCVCVVFLYAWILFLWRACYRLYIYASLLGSVKKLPALIVLCFYFWFFVLLWNSWDWPSECCLSIKKTILCGGKLDIIATIAAAGAAVADT